MRDFEDFVYCKEGCVNMFSDVSNFQVARARIESEEVCWDTVFKMALSEKERVASSTFRELHSLQSLILQGLHLESWKEWMSLVFCGKAEEVTFILLWD